MPIKKATECKDKNGRTLKVGDTVIARGRIVDLPMDLEDGGKAIVRIVWHAGVPLTDKAVSTDLEKDCGAPVKNNKKRAAKKRRNANDTES